MNETIVIGGELSLSNTIVGEVSLTNLVDGDMGLYFPIYPPTYQGEYTVTPSMETQVIPIAGLMANEDVIVNPIPSNYGLITWNGSVLTVS